MTIRARLYIYALLGAVVCESAHAASPIESKQHISVTTAIIFLVFVAASLKVTHWAARKTKTASDFFAAGGRITGFQNGLASAGDYLSAASFLGLVSSVYATGYDGLIYGVGFFVGWPIVLFLMAERARNLGKYTLVDIVSYRLKSGSTRITTAVSSLMTVFLYLMAQMVGAGELIQYVLGINYGVAVCVVGVLMVTYVTFGGMHATTWVQIIKACVMLGAATLLLFFSISRFGFSLDSMAVAAIASSKGGAGILGPGGLFSNPLSTLSLTITVVFGLSGMPHILMRFFTVPDVAQARKSAFVATTCIGYMFLIMVILGFASIVIVGADPQFFVDGKLGKSNMVAVYLAKAVGGDIFAGIFAAMLFASILAVTSGLLLAGASAVAHDIYANVLRRGDTSITSEVKVTKIATVLVGLVSVALAMLFKGQTLIFLVIVPGSIAVSANFPPLLLSMYWKGLTSRGATWGCAVGLFSAIGLLVLGPAVWVTILGHRAPVFPNDYPALFSMPLAFAVAYVVSVADRSERARQERLAYNEQFARAQTGFTRIGI